MEIEVGVVNQVGGINTASPNLIYSKEKWRRTKRETKNINEIVELVVLNIGAGEENNQVCDDVMTSRKRKSEDVREEMSLAEAMKQPRYSP